MNKPLATHGPKRHGRKARGAVSQRARTGPTPETAGSSSDRSKAFRVLIAVNRPRYRSRAERAVRLPDWEVRSLTNKEDPIGLINQKPPHIFICSDEFGRSKNMAF